MSEKTKTTVVTEIHEQTIIRRSRRTVSERVVDAKAAQPPGWIPSDVIEPPVREKPKWPGRLWKTVSLKSATVLEPLSRLLATGASKRKKNNDAQTTDGSNADQPKEMNDEQK